MPSSEDLKKKPKSPETIFGTNCMGENWTVCCPNFHLKYDRYSQTKRVTQIKYRGGIYRIFFCSPSCEKNIKGMALNTPDTFKKLFIKSVKPNGDLVIKHKDTNVPCQIAIKIDTYSDSGGGSGSGSGSKNAKQKGGSGRAVTRRNKKYSKSRSKSRFSKSRRNKTMRR
jgi:hypothetical protein